MHVLAITDNLSNIGGAEISARTILVGLTSHDEIDQVTVVGVHDPGSPQLNFEGVETIPVNPPPITDKIPDLITDLAIERRLAKAASSHLQRADIVHAHHRQSALALSHLDTSVPTIATIRDFWPTCPISVYHVGGDVCSGCDECLDDCVDYRGWGGTFKLATKTYLQAKRRHQHDALSGANCVVYIAAHLRERLQEVVPTPDQSRVIYNPVSLDPDISPTPFEDPVFVTASSLSDSKDIETVIRAMGFVTETHPNARLLVFGDGPQREMLELLADEVVPDSVSFRGRVGPDKVYSVMAGATATVFPSKWPEPFGRITVESMLLGTPVVGSNVGGIGEIVEHGETGLLFEPGDATTLASHLRALCSYPSLGSRLASAATERTDQFQTSNIVTEHVDLYVSLTGN